MSWQYCAVREKLPSKKERHAAQHSEETPPGCTFRLGIGEPPDPDLLHNPPFRDSQATKTQNPGKSVRTADSFGIGIIPDKDAPAGTLTNAERNYTEWG